MSDDGLSTDESSGLMTAAAAAIGKRFAAVFFRTFCFFPILFGLWASRSPRIFFVCNEWSSVDRREPYTTRAPGLCHRGDGAHLYRTAKRRANTSARRQITWKRVRDLLRRVLPEIFLCLEWERVTDDNEQKRNSTTGRRSRKNCPVRPPKLPCIYGVQREVPRGRNVKSEIFRGFTFRLSRKQIITKFMWFIK